MVRVLYKHCNFCFIPNTICITQIFVSRAAEGGEGQKQKQPGDSQFYELEKFVFFQDTCFEVKNHSSDLSELTVVVKTAINHCLAIPNQGFR